MRVINNKEKNRFETTIDGYKAFIEYKIDGETIELHHTEVDPALGGRGVASEMTETVLLDLEQQGLKVIPTCPFIEKYIERHPEWKSILAGNKN